MKEFDFIEKLNKTLNEEDLNDLSNSLETIISIIRKF